MIDIHCHILPGVDDGPEKMDESVAMAKAAAADGITKIIATPHINGNTSVLSENSALLAGAFRQAVSALNRRLAGEEVSVTIFPGAEINITLIDSVPLSGLRLNGTRYLLIEFPHTHLPANACNVIFKLILNGYRPILAHPERNPSVYENPKKLMALREIGALVQITADSLSSASDPDIRHCARYLLKKGTVDFIASDAHSATSRPPVLSAAHRVAARLIGRAKAADLFHGHPMALLKDAAINGT